MKGLCVVFMGACASSAPPPVVGPGQAYSDQCAVVTEGRPTLTKWDVLCSVKAQVRQLEPCLPGAPVSSVYVKWVIQAEGSVTDVQLADESLRATKHESCILPLVSKWRFPAFTEPKPVPVTFPFRVQQ